MSLGSNTHSIFLSTFKKALSLSSRLGSPFKHFDQTPIWVFKYARLIYRRYQWFKFTSSDNIRWLFILIHKNIEMLPHFCSLWNIREIFCLSLVLQPEVICFLFTFVVVPKGCLHKRVIMISWLIYELWC